MEQIKKQMSQTQHSEYLRLSQVFLKPVQEAFQNQELLNNQWNELNYLSKPDFKIALEEYSQFESIFKENNIDIAYFSLDNTTSIDSIYCRDASIATDFGIILCNMGKAGRNHEPNAQLQVYQQKGINILGQIQAPGTLEGGDVAWIDKKTLAVGHTYRTNEEGIAQLKQLLAPFGIEVLVAELPHFKGQEDVFHLMSILSPVAANLAVVYSPLMPIKFRNELLKRGFDFVEVPEEEFESMACNVLAISPRNCIMVDGNPITKARLEKAGCIVRVYKGEEISVKGGGGPTCLTRPLLRME